MPTSPPPQIAQTADQAPDAQRIRRDLAGRTGTDAADWHLVFKARYGLQIVFDALAADGPGTVATQIFTCATAVDPIVVAGLRPRYGEVSPESVALDPATLTLDQQTLAVVLQHTFGIVDERRSRQLRALADQAGALLVEDSCHCLARVARDEAGSPLADVSVHSFGAEKVLPTRFGGAVWVNPDLADAQLRARIVTRLQALPVLGRRIDLAARAYRGQLRVLNRLPGSSAAIARRALTAARAIEPPISPIEAQAGLPYPPMAPSPWMLAQIVAALPGLAEQERTRSAAVEVYRDVLSPVVQVPAAIDGPAPLVRFPFFVPRGIDAERVLRAVTAAGFYAGRWYRPALFPGTSDPAAYGYRPGDPALATTEGLIERVVNLPTTVSADEAHRAASVVRDLIA